MHKSPVACPIHLLLLAELRLKFRLECLVIGSAHRRLEQSRVVYT